jgi:serine protease
MRPFAPPRRVGSSLAWSTLLLFSLGWVVTLAEAQTTPSSRLTPRRLPIKPVHSTIPPGFDERHIEVKFLDGLDVGIGKEGYPEDRSGTALLAPAVLGAFQSISAAGGAWQRLAGSDENRMDELRARAEQKLHRELADMNTYFVLRVPLGMNTVLLLDTLNGLPEVELAVPSPMPMPAPVPGNYQANQGYLNAATDGIGTSCAWSRPGGTGASVTIVDLEYGWNLSHSDLPPIQTWIPPGFTATDPFNDPNHGTAVLASMGSLNNGFGTTGAAHGATFRVAPVWLNNSYRLATVLTYVTDLLFPGDVILVEQQTGGPNYTGMPPGTQFGLVPVEWQKSVYDAIEIAIGNGIHVVEAAGNGSQDLDDPIYSVGNNGHWPFLAANDSGAVIVGAGAAPAAFGGSDVDRSRLSFSNYGSRLSLQGWGQRVATAGYGDLYNLEGQNLLYTSFFSGTSSASPIVASAVALLEGIEEANGSLTSPEFARGRLGQTGSPQQTGTYPATQRIGPRPDLCIALEFPEPNPCPPTLAFVVDVVTGELRRITLATGASTLIVTGLGGPNGVALGSSGTTAYVTTSHAPYGLRSVNLTTGSSTLIGSPVTQPSGGIALMGGAFAYITEAPGGQLSRFNLFTGARTVAASGLSIPADVVLDASESTAYVVEAGSGELSAVNLFNGAITVVASGLTDPQGVALSPSGTTAYVTETSVGELSAINLSTGAISLVASGLEGPTDVTVNPAGSTAYVSGTYTPGEFVRVDLATGAVTVITPGGNPIGMALNRPVCRSSCRFPTQTGGPLGWTALTLLPQGVAGASGVVIGDHVYVTHGECCGAGSSQAKAMIYDLSTGTWNFGADASVARAQLSGLCVEDETGQGLVFTVGGRSGGVPLSNVETYNPVTNVWSSRAPMPTPRRGLGAAFVPGTGVAGGDRGSVYVLGGSNGGAPHAGSPLAVNEAYDVALNEWVTRAPMPIPMMDVSSTVYSAATGLIYVIGGYDDTAVSAAVQVYNPATNAWTAGPPMPTPRSNLSAGICGDKIYAIGGYNGVGNLAVNEVFDPVLGSWAAAPAKPTNASAMASQFVYTGTEIYAIGSGIVGPPDRFHEVFACGAAPPAPDIDSDGLLNREDNCSSISNPSQADGDADGAGDACDNCPTVANAGQANFDGDSEGNSCDPDDDNDGTFDGFDCAPFNPQVAALPGEVTNVAFTTGSELTWTAPGGSPSGLAYDVIRAAAAISFLGPAVCIESDDGLNTTATDPITPAVSSAFFYLVRAQNGCGYGPTGHGPVRDCP